MAFWFAINENSTASQPASQSHNEHFHWEKLSEHTKINLANLFFWFSKLYKADQLVLSLPLKMKILGGCVSPAWAHHHYSRQYCQEYEYLTQRAGSWSPIYLFPSQPVPDVSRSLLAKFSHFIYLIKTYLVPWRISRERERILNIRLPCRACLCCTTHPPPPRVEPQGLGHLGFETKSSSSTPSWSLDSLALVRF